jgi:hypothetical protein
MKSILLLSVLFCSVGYSQTTISPLWIKEVTSTINKNAESWGIDVDITGNVYWALNVDNNNQGLDVDLYKFNSSGLELWTAPTFSGGPGAQQSYVAKVKGNYVYVGGRACPFLVNTCDMMLMKINITTGVIDWTKTLNFSGNGYDEVDGLVIEDDAIYCGGWAHELESGIYNTDIGLWKLDLDGNTIWSNHFGQIGSAEHQDGHFVVDDNYIYAGGLWDGTGAANLYNGSSFVGRFSKTDGSFVDSTLFGHQSNNFLDVENELGMATDGEFLYMTGYSTPPGLDNWQLYIAKFDKDLNQLWYVDWGGEGTESARGIAVKDGIIYISGVTESETIVSGGERDGVLVRVDTSGNILSYHTWGNSDKNEFRDIVVDDNGVYIAGTTELASNSTRGTGFIMKIDGTVGVDETIKTDYLTFTLFPNPSNGILNVSFGNSNHGAGELKVMDVKGRLIDSKSVRNTDQNMSLNIENKGVFFVSINWGDYIMTKKIVNL